MAADDHSTGNPDVDIRIQLAETRTKVEGLTQTVEREFSRMADAIGKHADAVNSVLTSMRMEFVSKADFAALVDRNAKLERIVYGACGVILLAVLGALVALVVVKP